MSYSFGLSRVHHAYWPCHSYPSFFLTEATRKLGRNGFPILHTQKEATSALGDASRMKLSETLSTGADSANNSLKGERLTDTLDKTEKTSLTGYFHFQTLYNVNYIIHMDRIAQKIQFLYPDKSNLGYNCQLSSPVRLLLLQNEMQLDRHKRLSIQLLFPAKKIFRSTSRSAQLLLLNRLQLQVRTALHSRS